MDKQTSKSLRTDHSLDDDFRITFLEAERRANAGHGGPVLLPVPPHLASAIDDLVARERQLYLREVSASVVLEAGINRMLDTFEAHGLGAVS